MEKKMRRREDVSPVPPPPACLASLGEFKLSLRILKCHDIYHFRANLFKCTGPTNYSLRKFKNKHFCKYPKAAQMSNFGAIITPGTQLCSSFFLSLYQAVRFRAKATL